MMAIFGAMLSGLLAGVVHVWAGPDHLTAIAPLAVRHSHRSWMPGLRWGIGHASGVTFIGVLSLMLREWLPVHLLSSWGEFVVGIMLIGIGLWSLRQALQHKVHTHEHEHGDERHVHIHLHASKSPHTTESSHHHAHAAFSIGILHGLAGSSHLLGILPMLAFPSQTQSFCYLIAFAVGTVISMAGFSWAMGFAAQRAAGGGLQFYRGLMICCGVAAMAVGAVWIVQTFRVSAGSWQ